MREQRVMIGAGVTMALAAGAAILAAPREGDWPVLMREPQKDGSEFDPRVRRRHKHFGGGKRYAAGSYKGSSAAKAGARLARKRAKASSRIRRAKKPS